MYNIFANRLIAISFIRCIIMIKNVFFKNITIVECVIFFTAIVILISSVLPGREEIAQRSDLAADRITVTNMNTALSGQDPQPNTLRDVISALETAGFDIENGITPASEGCTFVWGKDEHAILLVKLNGESSMILYPEAYANIPYDPDKYPALNVSRTNYMTPESK